MNHQWPYAPAELNTMLLLQQQLAVEPGMVQPGRSGFPYLEASKVSLIKKVPDAAIPGADQQASACDYDNADMPFLRGEVQMLWRFLLSFEVARHRHLEDAVRTMAESWNGGGGERIRQVVDAYTGPQVFNFLSRTVCLGKVSYYAFSRLLHMTGSDWWGLYRSHVSHSLIQLTRARLRGETDVHLWTPQEDPHRASELLANLDHHAPGFVLSLIDRLNCMIHELDSGSAGLRGSLERSQPGHPANGQMAVV